MVARRTGGAQSWLIGTAQWWGASMCVGRSSEEVLLLAPQRVVAAVVFARLLKLGQVDLG